jgi:hypothetical protein
MERNGKRQLNWKRSGAELNIKISLSPRLEKFKDQDIQPGNRVSSDGISVTKKGLQFLVSPF